MLNLECRRVPQYSECGSPQATFENQFFFWPRIANTTNSSTPTLLFGQKLLLYRSTISTNTAIDFQDLKSTCDRGYMRNCDFQRFVSAHFEHSHQAPPSPTKPIKAPPSPHQMRSIKVFSQQWLNNIVSTMLKIKELQ